MVRGWLGVAIVVAVLADGVVPENAIRTGMNVLMDELRDERAANRSECPRKVKRPGAKVA